MPATIRQLTLAHGPDAPQRLSIDPARPGYVATLATLKRYSEPHKQESALMLILTHNNRDQRWDLEKWRDLHAFPREFILGWREG